MKSLPKSTAAVTAMALVVLWLKSPEVWGQRAPGLEQKPTKNLPLKSPSPLMADAPGPESPEAKGALDQARQRLLSYQSIQAKLVETVALANRRFIVNGSYLQAGGGDLRLRLEFQVKVGDTEGSILEVCDGQVLWTRHKVGGDTRISRRDVRQILQAAADNGLSDNLITVELGFGGLPGLLASIGKSIQFDQYKEDTADGRKLIVIEGGWKLEMLKFWQGDKFHEPLPDYVPARIRLYLDGESLFPRRILYLRRNADNQLRPKVSLDFSEIETDTVIPPTKFKFVPPEGVFPEDLTPQFLDQIKQRGQQRGNDK
ncbi:MAG: hypothetical protein FJ302_03045 [Planctomycetes bacterium]|nr:hypothetical protein [Planctomycetota bacterium]